MKIKIEEKLKAFLIAEGVLEQFEFNVFNDKYYGYEQPDNRIEKYIDTAFFWANTPEKHDFWCDLNEKFS